MKKLLSIAVLALLLLSNVPSATFAQSQDQQSLQQMASLISALQGILNSLKANVQALKGGAVQTAQAQTADITTGLVGHWKFDGDAQDASGNGNNGTITGGATFDSTNKKIGSGAINFDGVDDAVNAGSGASLDNVAPVTISAWIYPRSDGEGSVGRIIDKGAGRILRMISSKDVRFSVNYTGVGSTDLQKTTSNDQIPFNTWSHVVMTWNDSNNASGVSFYLNNVLVTSVSSQNGVGTRSGDATNNLFIGNDSAGASTFDGLMDDLRVYNRVLTSAEIQELYNLGATQPVDTTPPNRSSGSPSGALPAGTTQTTLSLSTDENATCKYSTTAGTAYSAMTNTFTTTGGMSHSTTVSGLQNGNSYTYYIRCQDTIGNPNTDDFTISFSVGSVAQPPPPPVIPGAQGFGITTPAGRGGTVYKVTNLNDSGPGSLRACAEATGQRVCIFETSGMIMLNSNIAITSPFLTIAGQTAPSPGITLWNGGLFITTNDILVQHIWIRVGDDLTGPGGAKPCCRDSITLQGARSNVVFDHVTASWGIDETMSLYNAGLSAMSDITIRHSIISEGLYDSIHWDEGATGYSPHSMGLLTGSAALTGDPVRNLSVLGTLFAHNNARNPLMRNTVGMFFANNVVYNYGFRASEFARGNNPQYPTTAAFIGNAYLTGFNTPAGREPVIISENITGTQLYLEDNSLDGVAPANQWTSTIVSPTNSSARVNAPTITVPGFTPKPNQEVKDFVLANAGARPADRDAIDTRIVNDVRNRTGRIKDCVVTCDEPTDIDAGDLPILAVNTRTLTPPSSIADNDGDGYTDLEEWIHAFSAQVENASLPPPTISLIASPFSITSGQSSTLSWSSTNTTSCTASGGWSGTKATSGTQAVSPTVTSTYTLTCTGTGGSVAQSASVSVTTVTPLPLVGDLNNDRTVNGLDWGIMAGVWFTNDATADINKDGVVNSIDFSLMNQNWGRSI